MTTSLLTLPPGLILIFGALLLPFLRGTARSAALLVLPLLTLWLIWTLPEDATLKLHFLGYDLVPLKARQTLAPLRHGVRHHGVRWCIVRATSAANAGAVSRLCLRRQRHRRGHGWRSHLAVRVLGADGDRLDPGHPCRGKSATHAAFRYAVIHLLGGVLLMAGIAGEIQATGSIAFGQMDTSTSGARVDPGRLPRERRCSAALRVAL